MKYTGRCVKSRHESSYLEGNYCEAGRFRAGQDAAMMIDGPKARPSASFALAALPSVL